MDDKNAVGRVELLMGATTETASKTSTTVSSHTTQPFFGRAIGPNTFFAGNNPSNRIVMKDGKILFRAASGQLVELPSDISVTEAIQLEADAHVAEKQIGKGPQPKPVVKAQSPTKPAPKPITPSKKAKKATSAVSKLTAQATAAAIASLKAVGSSPVAQYLVSKGTPSLMKGISNLGKLKQNEQTHDSASQKREQSEKTVVIPASENQSKSNADQVSSISARPAPVVEEQPAKQKLQEALSEHTPKDIEGVDNFKRDMKAQHIGNQVLSVIQVDKNAVTSSFADMQQTPPPAAPEHIAENLPPQEQPPSTGLLNLAKDAIAALQPQHTDLSNFTKDADNKLQEEGVTQEQLNMVDSGDLAEANKEKKNMESKAKSEPALANSFVSQSAAQLGQELHQEEQKQRAGMQAKRKSALGQTSKKQKDAKSSLEKKREEVAAYINELFQKTQNSVKGKLSALENQAMQRFDAGNAQATQVFEDTVKREIDEYKADRYSGYFGWARKAKDWLKGMDKLPRIKAIFENNRSIFVNSINTLVANITADNQRVIKECKQELETTKQTIKDYVDKLGPSLKDIGKQAAEEMAGKLSDLDQHITKSEQALQDKLKDKQQAAIKAIDEKIEKMKEAMSGALAKLGKLLLLAAKKFFSWALEKVGLSLADIETIINKGTAVLKAIFTKPVNFVKNLINAALTGFKNFGINFGKHLKDAVFEWLTGSLEGLVLPKTWDLSGIASVALQMVGISYQNIRKHLVIALGSETAVASLEKSFDLLKTLITEGPMAAWEQIKEMGGTLKEAFVSAVQDFIKTKIVEQAIQWLVSAFVPGAGIVKAIIGIYDTVMFFIQKAKQIMAMASNFISSVSEIAAGDIGSAADKLENGLARGMSLVISFLAQLLRLNGITQKIKDALQKVRDKVDAILSKVAKWIVDKAAKLGSRILGGNPNAPSSERVANGLSEAVPLVNRYAGKPVGAIVLQPLLKPIKLRHRLSRLDVIPKGKFWAVEAAASPAVTALTTAEVDGSTIAGMTSKIRYTSGTLLGRTVGQEMVADPLGPDHPMGQEPAGDNIWRPILVTDPAKSNTQKYIRGHLLNHNVGGSGATQNLFPITAAANDLHESQIESKVKQWVNDPAERKWVYYRVQVTDINAAVNPAGPVEANKIDANFVCTASVIDPSQPLGPSNRHNTISATITSRYQAPATVSNASKSTNEKIITARPEDQAASVAIPSSEEYKLDSTLYKNLHTIIEVKGLGTRHVDQAISGVSGLGPEITKTLYKAFELSLKNSGGDIGNSLNSNEKSNLTRLNNMKDKIHNALALWL